MRLFWELRVALSLARVRMAQGRQDEARQILAPVYGRFTEGFATKDLRAAKALLAAAEPAALSGHAARVAAISAQMSGFLSARTA